VLVWGRAPARGEVTIRPSRGRDVKVHVRDPRGYFVKRLAKRANSYFLIYGHWSSRRATPR
jgi:hypothetical protein